MAAYTYEMHDSRDLTDGFDGPAAVLRYRTIRAADEAAALASVATVAPSAFDGLPLKNYRLTPHGGGVFTTEANYGTKDSAPAPGQGDSANPPGSEGNPRETPTQPGEEAHLSDEYSFDTSGGTVHITQSILTKEIQNRGGGGLLPATGGAIGVSKDGVAGTDKVSPKLEFSITKEVAFITLAFFGFAAGEVLFLGARGQRQGDEWKVQYAFLTGKNRAEFVIVPGVLILHDVGGHDHIWVEYEDAESAGDLIQRPKRAYLEQIYESEDFTALGLG
jgi:hypothetical protein